MTVLFCMQKGREGMKKKMSVKQEAFCLAYAKSGNATQSYKDAGYAWKTEGSARVCAAQLLAKPNIKKRVAEIAEEARTAAIADIREIQETLTKVIRSEEREEQIVVEGCGDGVSEARIIKRAVQKKDIIKACEVLAKMQGGFDNTLKVEMTVPKFGGDTDLED